MFCISIKTCACDKEKIEFNSNFLPLSPNILPYFPASKLCLGTIHTWHPCKLFNPATSKILPSSWPCTPIFKQPPSPPSSNDNQSIKRKHNTRMPIICYQVFIQVGFCFQYQLINLVWLSTDFFHLAESNLVPRTVLKN